jgi:pimeloyl-ACP methyl ester carboxylesterase
MTALGTQGPRILLLPGLGSRGAGFARLGAILAQETRPLLVEYPEGRHAAVGAAGLARQVHAAVGQVDAVVASSFGGMVAAHLVELGATRAVAFLGSFTMLKHIGLRGSLIRLMGPIAEFGRPGAVAAAIAANGRVEARLVADIVPTTFIERRSVTHRAAAIPREAPPPALRDRDVSCLVIQGDRDLLVPPWAARRLLDSLPSGTGFHIISGAGHVPYFSHPDLVGRLVLRWLTASAEQLANMQPSAA